MKYYQTRPIYQQIYFVFVIVLFLLGSCKNKSETENISSNEILPEEKNIVETIVLGKKDFMQEIVSNGKLSAIQRAELYFENAGFIEAINTRNGQVISKGFQISNLKNDDYRFALKNAELNMEKAEIDKLDALIGMGYKQSDTIINPEHEAIADIRSGYKQAVIQLEEAQMQLNHTRLIAPFPGKVEGIFQRSYEKADLSKPFCTLINDNKFFINFPLLETEISKVNIGQKVTISPIAGAKQTTGTITEINPRIDENGLAWLKAEVKNPGGYLEGMNVKVSIKRAITGQLVVPKQAVVLRQNREVLFRFTQGTAYWTYINVLDENEAEYSVVAAEGATLELGDTVIVSNNLNLAHESEVEIK
jgi:membrane fusion protein (multidrug efflux system)